MGGRRLGKKLGNVEICAEAHKQGKQSLAEWQSAFDKLGDTSLKDTQAARKTKFKSFYERCKQREYKYTGEPDGTTTNPTVAITNSAFRIMGASNILLFSMFLIFLSS